MNEKRMKTGPVVVMAALSLCLAGCGGSKVLKDPKPLPVSQSLAAASDGHLAATLDWVIVRDGPGTWAKNADWDEYLIRVRNQGKNSILLTNIRLFDSLGTPIMPGEDRKRLVRGAKQAERRYEGAGITVKAGWGAGTLLTTGAVVGATSVGVVYTVGPLALSSGTAAAATGGVLLVPVFAVGGIMRGVNNSRVNEEIESRQALLSIELREGEEKHLDVFFPLTPSPRKIEFTYFDSREEKTLLIDTSTVLKGLHLLETAT